MSKSSLIGVVVVFHSGTNNLDACLKSICDTCVEARVIVVDASAAGAAHELASKYGTQWVDGKRNGGYSWAAHVGLASFDISPEVVVVSNPDVVFKEECIRRLAACAIKYHGVSYPVQYTSDGDQTAFNVLPQLTLGTSAAAWLGILRRSGRRRRAAITELAHVSGQNLRLASDLAGSGAVIAMPTQLWHKLGGLDRDYFLFEEDRTLGKRVVDAGTASYLCGGASVVHDGGFNNRTRSLLSVAEPVVSEQLAWRKYGNRRALPIAALQIVGLLGRGCMYGAQGDSRTSRLYFTACRVALDHYKGNLSVYDADGFRVPCVEPE